MSRYALVKKTTKLVANVCEWDGNTATWTSPVDCDAVRTDVGNIGDLYDPLAGTFTTPAPIPDPLAADLQRLFDYMPGSGSAVAAAVSAFIADTTKDPATRATMAAVRSLIRVLRAVTAS